MERKEFHYNRFKKIFEYLNLDCPIIEANAFYIESLRYQANPFDDVFEFLEYLKDKYRLFIASNGMTSVQIKRLELAGILKYFEKIYVSESIGYNKPEEGFFNYIVKDINDYDKSKYIIIGDRLDSDIEGGRGFNIKTVFLDRSKRHGNVDANYHINDLREIKKIS